MITFSVSDFNTVDQRFYDDIVSKLQLHQLTCPCCGHSGCLERHGSYFRYVLCSGDKVRLRILRVICSCGHTHALLPSSVIPYSQVLLKHHVFIALSGGSEDTATALQLAGVDVSARMVRYIYRTFILRWKQRLAAEAISLDSLVLLVKGCFQHFRRQFMQDKPGFNNLFSLPT